MRPFLTEGKDRVVIKSKKPKKYDVILYERAGGDLILHRMLGISGSKYMVCGDREMHIEVIDKSAVIGVMSHIERNGRFKNADNLPYIIWGRLWGVMCIRKAILKTMKRISRILKKRR